jgi:hypothetical protein
MNSDTSYTKGLTPIFIGGTGRSGTTILKRILATHSRIVALHDELRIIVDPGGALDLIDALSDRWSPYNADAALHSFSELMHKCGRSRLKMSITLEKMERRIFRKIGVSPRRYLGCGLAYSFGISNYFYRLDLLIERLSYHISNGSWIGSPPYKMKSKIYEAGPMAREEAEKILAGFIQDLYQHIACEGETHWLDDTPTNLLHAHELLTLFPNMRFIHIYRDLRDVLASYRGFSWGGDNLKSIARRLAGFYQRWYEIREKLPSNCYLEVSLENLVSEPGSTLGKICRFIGLQLEEQMTCISLDQAHSGRWKSEILYEELEQIKPFIAPIIKDYHYLDY